MFTNPLDSFHETVADAKEEREQLDRLLTISTPRERLLVAAIGVAVALLAAWLVFGSVTRTVALDATLVGPADGASEGRSVRALVWIARDVAPRIEAGMPASIELAAADGEAEIVQGEVAAIALRASSDVPAAFRTPAPAVVYRVDIALDRGLVSGSPATGECRLVIELGRQSPLALFGTRR